MAADHTSWKFTLKVLRIYHNRAVVKHFNKDTTDSKPTNGRQAIKSSLLIRRNDSALQCMNKQMLFMRIQQDYIVSIPEDYIVSIPESWIVKSIGSNIRQLKIIYRTVEKSGSGNYDLVVPHYNGSKSINPPRYIKGQQPVVYNLRDRTKIVVNAINEKEGRKLIEYLLRFVDNRYINDKKDNFVIPGITRIKKQLMKPIMADFYPEGQNNHIREWRIYF
jgi:hypothetical protein